MRAELRQEDNESVRLYWGARAPRRQPTGAAIQQGCGRVAADAVRRALDAVNNLHADDLWNDEAMLSRQVDLMMPSGETGLFVVILAVGERSGYGTTTLTFAQDSFLRALADTGRTDFGPSDFAPHRALFGYLAVPVSGQRLDDVQHAVRQTIAGAGSGGIGNAVSLEGVYAVGPRLAPVPNVSRQRAKAPVPIWRRVPRSSSAVG